MSYADDVASFTKAIKVVKDDLTSAGTFQTNATALQNDLDTLSTAGVAGVASALLDRRRDHAALRARGRAIVDPTLVQIGKTINSDAVVGDRITDYTKFFRDWRYYQDNTADEKVTARSVTFASEPAAAATGILRRVTVGPFGAGDKIESARKGKTVVGRVKAKNTQYQSTIELGNDDDGPIDDLDYTAASPRKVRIDAINEANTGNGVSNATMRSDVSSNGAPPTTYSGWTYTKSAGTVTVVTSPVWRSLPYVTKIVDASSDVTWAQPLPSVVTQDGYRPWLPGAPLYMEASWTGDITITWGSKSQAFTESDLSGGAWVFLMVDRDADLYPVNFDTAGATWSIRIQHDAAMTKYMLIGGFYACPGTVFEDINYFHFSHSSYPAIEATLSFADTTTAAGIIQDRLAFLYGDEFEGVYLMTAGTNTISDP